MESMEKGKEALISSIEADAQADVDKIVQEACDRAQEKKVYTQKKVQSILQVARDKAEVLLKEYKEIKGDFYK